MEQRHQLQHVFALMEPSFVWLIGLCIVSNRNIYDFLSTFNKWDPMKSGKEVSRQPCQGHCSVKSKSLLISSEHVVVMVTLWPGPGAEVSTVISGQLQIIDLL